MKVVGGHVGEVCSPFSNTFDCTGERETAIAIGVCVAATGVLFLFALYVLYTRIRYGLPIQLFRKVDGYWLLLPLDGFVVCGILESGLFIIYYTLLLLDQPKSWMARNSINSISLFTGLLMLAVVTLGIISSIPPSFGRRRRRSARPTHADRSGTKFTANLKDSQLGTSEHRHLIMLLPSPAVLSWGSLILITVLFLGISMPSFALGWARDNSRADIMPIANQLIAITPSVIMILLLFLTLYYWYGFYRIVRHTAKQSTQCGPSQNNLSKAAVHFRHIFNGLLIAHIASIIITAVNAALAPLVATNVWLSIGLFCFGYAVFYPIAKLYIYYTILRNSKLCHQRTRQASTGHTSAWDVTSGGYGPQRRDGQLSSGSGSNGAGQHLTQRDMAVESMQHNAVALTTWEEDDTDISDASKLV